MAVIRLFPSQDTSIVRGIKVDMGRDEVLELGMSSKDDKSYPSRILMQFDQRQVRSALKSVQAGVKITATLHLTTTLVQNLPIYYTVEVYPLLESWEEGVNRIHDILIPKDNIDLNTGATWELRTKDQKWEEPGGKYDRSNICTQGFGTQSPNSLDVDVSEIVNRWVAEEIPNHGFLLKLDDEDIILQLGTRISFYSVNTHTIYSPFLELKWDDSVYEPGDTKEIREGIVVTSVQGLQQEFRQEEKRQFRVGVKPLFPERVFSTSSIYNVPYVLPKGTKWGIKDEYTAEMAVSFSEGTTLSADTTGSFFTLDMNLLEPERYYRVLFQVQFEDGRKYVLDNREIFKVVRR